MRNLPIIGNILNKPPIREVRNKILKLFFFIIILLELIVLLTLIDCETKYFNFYL